MLEKFQVASTEHSLTYLIHMLNSHKRIFYSRFGDGVFEMILGRPDAQHPIVDSKLQTELTEALLIKDKRFIKAAVLGYPKEPGMRRRMFIEGSVEGEWPRKYHKIAAETTDERIFYNPIVFHYMAVFNPTPLVNFVNTYIKPKTKMFVGGDNKQSMEKFYGPINYYIQTPYKGAYYSIDKWWPKVKKYAKRCQVVLPSAGLASHVICKRLWNLGINIHCINIGSLNNAIENKGIKSWIKLTGAEQIRKNIGIE